MFYSLALRVKLCNDLQLYDLVLLETITVPSLSMKRHSDTLLLHVMM
jgi:hypothetical protein